MKTLKVSGLLLLTLIAGFSACKKDNSQAQLGITGKWVAQYSYQAGKVYQDVYQFNADSSFSQTRQLADSVSGQPVSYQYYATGKFHLSGDKLKLYSFSIKYSDTYGTFEQLTKTQLITDYIDYTLALDADAKAFHFVFPPCPPNANCIATLIYHKK